MTKDILDALQAPPVDELANFIRSIDGNHSMGAGTLAEHICEWLSRRADTGSSATLPQAMDGCRPAFDVWCQTLPKPVRDNMRESLSRGESYTLKAWEAAWNRRAATSKSAEAWQPKFEVMAYEQEQLAIKFCNEIAGKAGGKGSPPDPVRLLEMAEALYLAERNDPVVGIAAPSASRAAPEGGKEGA